MKLSLITISLICFLTACSSQKVKPGVENVGHEAIVGSINGDARPSWVDTAAQQPFYEDGEDIVSVGSTVLNGDSARTDAGFKITDLDAKAKLSKTLKTKIESFEQVASEGLSFDSINLQSMTSEVSKLNLSNARPGRRYYEKVAVTQENGTIHTELRLWSEVRLSKEDFKRNLVDAAKDSSGSDNGLSKAFGAIVQKHFDQVVNGDSTSSKPAPASE